MHMYYNIFHHNGTRTRRYFYLRYSPMQKSIDISYISLYSGIKIRHMLHFDLFPLPNINQSKKLTKIIELSMVFCKRLYNHLGGFCLPKSRSPPQFLQLKRKLSPKNFRIPDDDKHKHLSYGK